MKTGVHEDVMRKGVPLALCLLAACSALPSPVERAAQADSLALRGQWQRRLLETERFALLAYASPHVAGEESLTVYIEGDGFAWVSGTMPSTDPTPLNPVALRLALAQPRGNVAYLGRPCQFVGAGTESCQQRYWTNGRFAPEVVAANAQAVGVLKDWFGASELTLVGYSGGAAIAAMVAAVRQDVSRLVTVAGNLDHRAWTAYQRVQPLSGSLNAVDFASALAHVSQMHFVGAEDKVIPPALALEWGEGLLGAAGANLRIKRGFDHHCCWVQQWPSLWDELPE